MTCPECGADCEHIEPEPDIGIVGGLVCSVCDWAADELEDDGTEDRYEDRDDNR